MPGSPFQRVIYFQCHEKSSPETFFLYFFTREVAKVEKNSQAKRVVVVSGESIRVNRIVRLEGELFAGEF